MLCALPRTVLGAVAPKIFIPRNNHVRNFWEYVNMMFNKPDTDRIKQFGPDRACAEWVLRNGGKVVWAGGKRLADYNLLPPEKQHVPKLVEIDGTDSSISHYGFPHLIGCTQLSRVILHNSNYIDDRALKGLSYGRDTITHLQVSKCINVTDAGIKELKNLHKLETLILFHLESVTNLEECKLIIQLHLPRCKIQGLKDGVPINEKQ
ncbi:hypothetical protein B5X24_HaOG210701 [Helicoverpa armigera]|uniref:Uncharacterized protein n=1 Tax=Helicoverpa armigera TaxID=29058 RepID=A0A2W1BBS6_HELAM|nr:ATP synthase subunit s, mitochondrial [Helicoverpa armigera]PZC72722.1 hypothetical protein B5X24_HaOG210701 [Helicoverpa armigera]